MKRRRLPRRPSVYRPDGETLPGQEVTRDPNRTGAKPGTVRDGRVSFRSLASPYTSLEGAAAQAVRCSRRAGGAIVVLWAVPGGWWPELDECGKPLPGARVVAIVRAEREAGAP